MTFEQALEKKKEFGETYTRDETEMIVAVGPSREEDLQRFLVEFRSNPYFEDEDSIKFSSDQRFAIYGINLEIATLHLRLA